MVVCGVPGCGSNSNRTSKYTLHRLPKALIPRASWIIALGATPEPPYVCSRHFEPAMFMKGNVNKLTADAVPKLFLQSLPNRGFDDAKEAAGEGTSELVACRVCLAVDGRLSAISSGMEDVLAAVTGVAMPEDGFPRHLCSFCRAKLSKCAAFRDSCRRSTALLRTLAERGPLKMNEITRIDRHSFNLTDNLASINVYQYGTAPLIEITPIIKTERIENSDEETKHVEVEAKYLDNRDCQKEYSNIEEVFTVEIEVEKQEPPDVTKVKIEKLDDESEFDNNADVNEENDTQKPPDIKKVKIEKIDEESEIDDVEMNVDNDSSDVDTDASEEIIKMQKKVESLCQIPTKPTNATITTDKKIYGARAFDVKAFEKKYNVDYTKANTAEEQKKEIEDKKMNNKLKYCCDLCGKAYNREQSMINHMWSHDPRVGPFECGVCRQRFPFSHKLMRHARKHRDMFRCRECGLVSRDSSRAKSHFKEHGGGSHACPYCNEAYVRKASYFNHIRTAHPERNEACDECGETFLSASGVRKHKMMTHRLVDKEVFKCKDCDVTFLNAEALQKHTDLSSDCAHAALWPCTACGDSCGSEAGLAAHAQDKHQHHCNECGITFSSVASFSVHVDRKHRGLRASRVRVRRPAPAAPPPPPPPPLPPAARRQHVCDVCGRKMKSAKYLEYHRNSHFGIKPFSCTLCDKRFSKKAGQQIHMTVHTGERPYRCEQCPQAFTLQGNLTRHVKNVHMRVQEECKFCGKSMGAGSLPLHVRTIHLNQPPPPRKPKQITEKPSSDS